jgi:hypothetical protein
MAVNKTLLTYIAFDLFFLACAGLLIGIPIVVKDELNSPPNINTVARNLLLDECPLICMLAFPFGVNGANK